MDKNIPILYVFVRSELQSMTPGKAQAHSGHAANAFVFHHYIRQQEPDPAVGAWLNNNQGFGTQINLIGTWDQVTNAVKQAKYFGFAADIVRDPSYPYRVTREIYNLLPINIHTADPVIKDSEQVTCFRYEETAAYIFGNKNELESILCHFQLHP